MKHIPIYMDMAQDLFRAKNLEKLSSPEQLDRTLTITSPRGWLFLLALGLIVLSTIFWGVIGTIPETTGATGITIHQDGLNALTYTLPVGGVIDKVLVEQGQTIKQGQPILKLNTTTADGKPLYALSNITGQVVEMFGYQGSIVTPGAQIGIVENNKAPLQVVLYVPFAMAKKVKAGMQIDMAPSDVEKENFGLLKGKVKYVGDFPVSSQGLKSLLQNDLFVNSISALGPVVEIDVELIKDPTTVSGLKWTTKSGPPFKLVSGTEVSGQIVLNERRPIEMVLPIKISR